ncbi:alpha-L-rhamnosidase [Demequina zhanjiangensis]|uniref:alpha-L-rhamnosidase n=1 Tax=Demequina zhanjiangensis TaxID=3051659 RepID=A0ABT8G231_9MICO|nr:alpha-L-rhamnosidase [Demequina sp. SYSU T00b26]MDN4473062.1 family 78 glycoside hydrolase catalytic domain [Demequina sp. SYSU T00b26]
MTTSPGQVALAKSMHSTEGSAPYMRRSFELASLPARATLRASALGIVDPYVNGDRIGDQVLAPGWTSYRHRVLVSEYDVTEALHVGENVIGAIVGHGWAAGRLGWDGRRSFYVEQPALFMELVLEHPDGTRQTLSTDEGFVSATGAFLADDLYDGEHYDARKHPHGWNEPGFDASGWSPVATLEWPAASFAPMTAEPIRRIETLTPVSLTSTAQGAALVDFGQNISGWVRLHVRGPEGTKLTIRHGELLTPEGDLETTNLRSAKAIDTVILAGSGRETWEPTFTFHGFRYCEIVGWPGEIEADDIEAVVVHSDMRRIGHMTTSDPNLNQLHANAVWSMRDNFVGLPTDCPQRDERLGWTGDINAFAPTASFLYDVRGVLSSWLADVAVEQRELGSVPWFVPDTKGVPCAPAAFWSDAVIGVPYAMYLAYGDLAILEAAYPSMTAFIAQVEAELDERGLWSSGYQFGDWLDPDAPGDRPDKAKADPYLVASAYFYKDLQQAISTAEALGHEADAAHFTNLATRLRSAFLEEYVSPRGRIVDQSPTSYALAITSGLLDGEQLAHAGDYLATRVAESGYRISTGFVGTPFLLDALSSTGHTDVAFRVLLQTENPSFLFPVLHGATTIWERWDSVRADGTLHPAAMTSLNHYAFGAVADWMHRVIGGLTAVEPGYRRMRIAPHLGGNLTSSDVSLDTPYGPVRVTWRIEEGEVMVSAQIPDGAEALIVLPSHPEDSTVEVGSGDHSWTYALPVPEIPDVDLDSPTIDLVRAPGAWDAVFQALVDQMPFLASHLSEPVPGDQLSSRSVRWLIRNIPNTGPDTEAAVERALDKWRVGA